MNTPHSAAPQALGYLYQVRHSLLALLKDDREEAAVVLEGLDDVAVEGNNHVTLDQLKHHVKRSATLTSQSPDLWKTIRVWSSGLATGAWNPNEVTLNLITTASASTDTVAYYLREGRTRDTSTALNLLRTAAQESGSQELAPAVAAFQALSVSQQLQLVNAIYVRDQAPNIQEIESAIKKQLYFATSAEYLDAVYIRLEGWWFPKVVNQLISQARQPITRLELREVVCEISRQFRHDSLPLDYTLVEPDERYYTIHNDRQFVRQLRQLNINLKRVRFAVIDYYRAFEQRTRWAQEDLLIDEELITYEKRLKEQWERWVADITDEFDDLEANEQCVKFGRQVYSAMQAANIPIRPSMPVGHEYVMRGSYHMLTDEEDPHVCWHPKFLDQLAQLQAAAAAS
ncbi:ABC-three component system protein [Hymenobacter psychrotolerans]|uniref:ABC-three component systems C-terminal domain-containing protein n=1 Tax=Hymenobacter psychrotolerans DSM 18569 TaxID=1121959 RepID=A0A1M6UPB1_9BACT|nr:ABC-three component system protein [Hymenobacter psychrotolerans]SHK70989.1 hypothetical protein SAMN02746009_01431 [Hymenobacter psychrotolerans DSM 18569]